MLYSTIVQRDETGFNMLFEAARAFEEENVLEGILACHFTHKKLEQTLNLVRMYQARLNIESMDLAEFSVNFIEQYATNHNECFRITEKLVRRIGTTFTGSIKLFRKFCPVVHRKLDGTGNVVPVLDYSRLTCRQFHGQLFGPEAYSNLVQTLLFEISTFFYHLVTTLTLCKDMIRREEEVMGDDKRLREIFDKSCDEALRGLRELNDALGQMKCVSEEELRKHRENACHMKEWLSSNYHAHDKKWLIREAYLYRLAAGSQHGLDDLASILWAKNPEWGRKVCDIIPKLDSLNIHYKHSKKAEMEGKKGTFDTREMVYLIKWSAVSHMSDDGKEVIDENNERRFYEHFLRANYKGDYLLPSWQAVCRERKYLNEHITIQMMADCFAKHLPEQSKVA